MLQDLVHQAITAASKNSWENAITLNQEILELDPNHIPSLNRLAKAYCQIDQPDKAIQTYQKVLELDKFNSIAKKNIEKLNLAAKNSSSDVIGQKKYLINFIEEPGKTKLFPLSKLANQDTLASLEYGEVVSLELEKRWIRVVSQSNQNIGIISDQESFKLRQYMEEGNVYEAGIKTVTPNKVIVFVRELTKAPQLKGIPSFSE